MTSRVRTRSGLRSVNQRCGNFSISAPARDARRIAVLARPGKGAAAGPPVVWLGGFRSDMRSTKAEALDAWAAANGRAFVRFDYSGHGESTGGDSRKARSRAGSRTRSRCSGAFARRAGDPRRIVDGRLACAPCRARPHAPRPARAPAGLVLIAPATDFTERLMWDQFPEDVRRTIERAGLYLRPSAYSDEPYPITRRPDRGRPATTCSSASRSRPAARSTSCKACRTPTCPGAMRSSSSSICRATASR